MADPCICCKEECDRPSILCTACKRHCGHTDVDSPCMRPEAVLRREWIDRLWSVLEGMGIRALSLSDVPDDALADVVAAGGDRRQEIDYTGMLHVDVTIERGEWPNAHTIYAHAKSRPATRAEIFAQQLAKTAGQHNG